MGEFITHILVLWGLLGATVVVLSLLRRAGMVHKPRESTALRFVMAAFGIILGFTTFFATQQYVEMEEAVQTEATSLRQAAGMVGAFPSRTRFEVRRQMYCAATAIIDDEWPAMRKGSREGQPSVNRRLNAVYITLVRSPQSRDRQALHWYENTVSAALDLSEQRQTRLLLSEPRVPHALWFLIYACAVVLIAYLYLTLLPKPSATGPAARSGSDGKAGHLPVEQPSDAPAGFWGHGRRERVWTLIAVGVVLTAVVVVLAGFEDPIRPPFGIEPEAIKTEQHSIGELIDVPHGVTAGDYCRAVPLPQI
jgi:hypothetical protein